MSLGSRIPVTAYIGLGGNVGDVISNIAAALRHLDQQDRICVVDVSRLYRTAPWGLENQDWFHNACVEVTTQLRPMELLNICLDFEKTLGRQRDIKWGPRPIDLDILIYGDKEINLPNLTIPHPRIKDRLFVLQPLCDLSPELLLDGEAIKNWRQRLEDKGDIEAVELENNWWYAR